MSSNAQKRKNKKKYYQSSKKFKHGHVLEPGMKGFIITCSDEHKCIREAYNLLNQFADELYGPEFTETANDESEDFDISKQLAKEISAIKSSRRFQQVFTKVKGIIFISTTVPDPRALVNKIFETVISTGKKNSRFILKLKPVAVTCKPQESDIHKSLDSILQQYSSIDDRNKKLKYKVESKVTFNDSLTSSHLISYVRDSVKSVELDWTACILEPDVVISFHIMKNVCCISILDNYEKYRKYNLSIVSTPTVESSKSKTVANESSITATESEGAGKKDVGESSEQITEGTSDKDGEGSEQVSEGASEKDVGESSEQISERTSEKDGEGSEQISEGTSEKDGCESSEQISTKQ